MQALTGLELTEARRKHLAAIEAYVATHDCKVFAVIPEPAGSSMKIHSARSLKGSRK